MSRRAKKAAKKFLTAWQRRDWPRMLASTQLSWRTLHEDPVHWLKSWFGLKNVESWKIAEVKSLGKASRDVFALIEYGKGPRKIRLRVIGEKRPYQSSTWGKWGVNPVSCLKERTIEPKEAFHLHDHEGRRGESEAMPGLSSTDNP